MEGGDEADDGGFAGARRSHEGGGGAGFGSEADVVQDGLAGVVLEGHVVEGDVALEGIDLADALGIFVLGALGEDFLGAIESGEGFCQLRADGNHLEHGGNQESEVQDEREQSADGERRRGGQNLAGADIHDGAADHSHHHGGREGHQRDGGEGAHDVVQQALHARCEHACFPGFGVIAFDDAHARQRLGQTAGDIGVDLAALAEDGADLAEGHAEADGAHDDEEQGETGQQGADAEQDEEREQRRQHAAEEFHQPGADEVAHALHVAHDAGDQGAGFIGIVIGHRQTADVLLHLAPQFGNEALPFLGKQLGKGERGDALNDGGGENGAYDPFEEGDLVLVDHIIDQELGSAGQDQTTQSANEHQQEAEGDFAAPRTHQFLEEGQGAAQVILFGLRRRQDYAFTTEYTIPWMIKKLL